ncbi:MAG: ABC transporter permease [Prevotella sp.]|nr:ABC transporter permease [Prevotella sp.]
MLKRLHDICYIWAQEMKSLVHDEGVAIFFIVVPIFYPLLYSWAYNNEVVEEVPVAVVDMSHSATSRQFARQYDASPNVKVAYRCNDILEARDLMEKQVVHGFVVIPTDFDNCINRMEQAHISVFCDMSLMLTYKAIFSTATSVVQDMNADIQVAVSSMLQPDAVAPTARQETVQTHPLDFDEVQLFNPTGGYGSFIIPAVLMLIIQQTLVLGIGLSAGTARENNRYKDLVPINRHYTQISTIIFGKSMCYFMVYIVIAAWLTLAVPKIFHFTSLFPPRDLLHLMLPYLLACIFFGMFVSCIVRYRENVMLFVVFASVPMLFLSGVSWPQSAIPSYWQGFSWLFPSTFGVRAFVRMNSMGATLADVREEYICLWLQMLAYFFATFAVYRYQLIRTRRHALQTIENIQQQIQKAKQR